MHVVPPAVIHAATALLTRLFCQYLAGLRHRFADEGERREMHDGLDAMRDESVIERGRIAPGRRR